MSLRIFNTLTRQLEELVPLAPGHVRLYTCGPTVYNYAHIGNFRAYVFEDLLRRYIHFAAAHRPGTPLHRCRLTQVMNLTDVDDKTIRASREQGLPLQQFTAQYIQAFYEDRDVLRIQPAEVYPAATDHVPAMVALIQKLLDKGVAYQSDDGSIYFSIARFPAYGRLAHLDLSGLRAGARVAQDEYEKESAADFALWKAWDEQDGEVGWDAPWGRGRPGWHIECSAMSMQYLGESFDLHTGGVDNIFPHHEDEIAQSEAATGQPFVKYWMHCAHLVVDGKKMSKSLGNFFTLRDLLAKGYSGREIRFVLLATHYRQALNFTFESLAAARAALARLDEFTARLRAVAGPAAAAATPDWAVMAYAGFVTALEEDLNISQALGALFDMVTAGNRAMNDKLLAAAGAAAVLELMKGYDDVLGFLQPAEQQADAQALVLLDQRQHARAAKNWAEADRLRHELNQLGWAIQDTPQGPKLKRMASTP